MEFTVEQLPCIGGENVYFTQDIFTFVKFLPFTVQKEKLENCHPKNLNHC